MTADRGALPTLTEVIDVEGELPPAGAAPVPLPPESLPIELPSSAAVDPGDELTAQVWDALRPRIDALLKDRLREVLATELSLLAEDTVHRVRGELASAVQGLVAQAVEDVLARRRKP